jgi:polyisoprenoid-binding protein YceI
MTLLMSRMFVGVCLVLPPVAAFAADEAAVEIRQGKATFHAETTVPVIDIHGQSTALAGRARIRHDGANLVIEALNVALPIKTLSTGMGLRDAHMRKYVFTTTDGDTPDLRFVSDRVVCPGAAHTAATCQIAGDLHIRGTARPFVLDMKVKGDGGSYRAAGDGIVKLSVYGIERPSQLGVTTSDDVKLHVEFVVKRSAPQMAQASR